MNTGLPMRDIWYRHGTTLVVFHVHYLGTWETLDESQIAQVNVRFPSSTPYFYESHPDLATGQMAHGWNVTALAPERRSKDPTKWMDGAPQLTKDRPPKPWTHPPVWSWRDDPSRAIDLSNPLTKAGSNLVPLVYPPPVRQRFQETHDLLDFALTRLETAIPLSFPPGTKAGGADRAAIAEDDPNHRPFSSPLFWAGFTITGAGSSTQVTF